MGLTSFSNFVFFYMSLRLLVDGMEELLIQPTAWYYVRFFGQTNLFLGFLLAAYSIGALVFAPCCGVFDVRFKASKILLLICGVTKFIGNILYLVPVNANIPLVGRLMSGIGEATIGVVYGAVAQATNDKNRAQAFLYFDGLYSIGTACGPMVGSFLTFKFNVLNWEINAGNSPGLILAIIWLLLLILTVFLPNDFTQNYSNMLKSNESSSAENESESEAISTDDTKECSTSRICCLYFVIFQSWTILNIGLFYTPLLAVHHIGLGLVEIKLLYLNGALFSFFLFVGNYAFSSYISEKSFIAIGIASHTIPLLILFYFAFSWNEPHTTNSAYLLLILLSLLSVAYVIFPLASSLLSKETPVDKASLYQSVGLAMSHAPVAISRIIAGATFNKLAITFVAVGLSIGLVIESTWFWFEYCNLYPAAERKK